jgi:hypothetical protein
MQVRVYDVRCLMCGTEVGQIVGSAFVAAPGAQPGLVLRGRLPRCAQCGGSLYLDPAEARLLRPPAPPRPKTRSEEVA